MSPRCCGQENIYCCIVSRFQNGDRVETPEPEPSCCKVNPSRPGHSAGALPTKTPALEANVRQPYPPFREFQLLQNCTVSVTKAKLLTLISILVWAITSPSFLSGLSLPADDLDLWHLSNGGSFPSQRKPTVFSCSGPSWSSLDKRTSVLFMHGVSGR